jgi:hypothetical protein
MNEHLISETAREVGYNASRLSRILGIDYADAREAVGKLVDTTPIVRPTGPMPTDIKTLGKGRIARHVIAVKANGDAWPAQFALAIHTARKNFDSGTHIMCQEKRKDGWVVLYSIPRRFPLRNPVPFFARNWGI